MLREYARWRVAIAGHVINLTLTRTENREYISVNGKRPFPVYRRCGDVGG